MFHMFHKNHIKNIQSKSKSKKKNQNQTNEFQKKIKILGNTKWRYKHILLTQCIAVNGKLFVIRVKLFFWFRIYKILHASANEKIFCIFVMKILFIVSFYGRIPWRGQTGVSGSRTIERSGANWQRGNKKLIWCAVRRGEWDRMAWSN